jgi:hypothetical protein
MNALAGYLTNLAQAKTGLGGGVNLFRKIYQLECGGYFLRSCRGDPLDILVLVEASVIPGWGARRSSAPSRRI